MAIVPADESTTKGFVASLFKGWNRLVTAKGWKFTVLLAAIAVAIIPLLFLYEAERWRLGVGVPDDVGAAALSFVTAFTLPLLLLVVVCMSRRGWQAISTEKIYRFQAWISTALVLIFALFVLYQMLAIVVWEPYAETVTVPDTDMTTTNYPCKMKLVSRVQTLCTYTSWLMLLSVGWALFSRGPEGK